MPDLPESEDPENVLREPAHNPHLLCYTPLHKGHQSDMLLR